MIKITLKHIAPALLMLSLGNAQAALVNFSFTGDVVAGDANFGLADNSLSAITVSGQYDDSTLDEFGDGFIDFTFGSGNTFTISAGTQSYTESNDIGFASYIEIFSFNTLLDFDFLAEIGTNGVTVDGFSSFGNSFDSLDDGGTLFGDWNDTITTSVVPVPAAVWLFGSGLLGLVGVARRKAA